MAATPAFHTLPLGKKLGVVRDRRTFTARQILDVEQVKVPTTHRVGGKLSSVPVFANDTYGDCTCASQGHRVITQERSASQHEVQLTDQDILDLYRRVGWDGTPQGDNGAYELDVLNEMRRNGLGREKDGTPHTIKAFAAVNWNDHAETLATHYEFGGLKVCAGLPLSAADQLNAGLFTWDVVTGPRGEWGSWGGHSLYSHAYDRDGLRVWTWGYEVLMTWAWVAEYVDEAYCVISEDYIRTGGTTPQGFDAARLDQLLAQL